MPRMRCVQEDALPNFLTWIRSKCGTIIEAWRNMDRDGSGEITFPEFCIALRELQYSGKLQVIFKPRNPSRFDIIEGARHIIQ